MAFWERPRAAIGPPAITRESAPFLLMILIVPVFAWTVIRDLRDLTDRLTAAASSSESLVAETGMEPPSVTFDELAMLSSSWFGAGSAQTPLVVREIVNETAEVAAVAAAPAEPPVEPQTAPVEIVAAPLPQMKLSGIVIGVHSSQIVFESGGEKRRMAVGDETGGWRLVELDRLTATFESPSGLRETVRMYAAAR